MIDEQVRRAKEQDDERRREQVIANGAPLPDEEPPELSRELIREEGDKVTLSFSLKAKPTRPTSGSVSPPTESDGTPFASAATTDSNTTALPTTTSTSSSASTFLAPPAKAAIGFTPRANAFKVAAKPLAGNAFKAGNALKPGAPVRNPLGTKPMSISLGGAGAKRPAPMSAVEAIFQEEMAKKSGGGKRGRFD